MRVILMAMMLGLIGVGCVEEFEDTHKGEYVVQIVETAAGLGEDAMFLVHRDPYTVVMTQEGYRFIVPGKLGKSGDIFKLKNIPKCSLYGP